MEQKLWQSWAFWVALAALIGWASKTVWGVDIDKTLNDLLNVVFPVVTFFGVVNNPYNKTGIGANNS